MGKLKKLVESEKEMEKFVADFRIPRNVFKRQEGEVVIPIIAFIKGGMRIPIGSVIRDYLRHF